MLYQNIGSSAQRNFGGNGAISPDFQIEFVVIGLLPDTSSFHTIGRFFDRTENGVHGDLAQRKPGSLFSRAVSPAPLDNHLDVQVHIVGVSRQQIEIRIDNLNFWRADQITSGHRSFVGNLHVDANRVFTGAAHPNLFHVENQPGGIFAHVRDCRKLVMNSTDTYGRNSRTRQTGKQHPAQRIAQRKTVTTLQWADNKMPIILGNGFNFNLW
jgi:hypothetical protein